MNFVRVHLLIHGGVTGVGFRYWVVGKARKLGLTGWVQNVGDTVGLVVEGQKEKVEKLIQLCREGPPVSVVNHVDVTRENYRQEFADFTIRK